MVHSQACGGLSQAVSPGGEEAAEEAAFLQLLDPGPPGVGAGAQTIQDAG